MRYFLLLLLFSPICHADITVSDFVGREVRLEQPARRIVALAPHIVENIYSAGAGEALVGVVSYSDYPLSAKVIPKVGSYKAFSLETILALQPDLVVMWASGNGMTTLDDLAALKVPVYVSEPRGLVDIGRAIRDYGTLAGSETTAEQEAFRIDRAISQLAAENNGRESISVLYQVWHEPLQTLNGKHLISAVIELCGGYNIFADAVSLAPKISIESQRLSWSRLCRGQAGCASTTRVFWPGSKNSATNTIFF